MISLGMDDPSVDFWFKNKLEQTPVPSILHLIPFERTMKNSLAVICSYLLKNLPVEEQIIRYVKFLHPPV